MQLKSCRNPDLHQPRSQRTSAAIYEHGSRRASLGLPNKWVVSSLLDGQLLLSHQRLADEKRHQLRKWQLSIRPFQDLLMHNETVNEAPDDSVFREGIPPLLSRRARIKELDNNNGNTEHIDIL